jgi:mRNA-degrading endonuclease RelE of RelBE toxin-antitoxin system
MKLEIREGAVEDLKQFNEKIRNRIRNKIAQLRDSPLGENTSLLNKQGLEIFRLKLKNSELDHRVFFDLKGDKVVILGVEHRDDAYTKESIDNIRSRRQ